MQNPFETQMGLPPGPMNPGSFNGPPFDSMGGMPPPGSFGGPNMPYGGMPGSQNTMPWGSYPSVPPPMFPPSMGPLGMPPPGSMPPGRPGGFEPNRSWAPAMASDQFPSSRFDRSLSPMPRRPGDENGRWNERYQLADRTNERLEADLNDVTNDGWSMFEAEQFSAVSKAGLDDVDWRVPRVQYCKDPKYNRELPIPPQVPPTVTKQVMDAKARDGDMIERQVGEASIQNWSEKLKPYGMQPPPPEVIKRPGCPFVQVIPDYKREDDVWETGLTVRTLDDAMRGDVTKPLPRPILFPGDFENFHEGKYLKDDCPIA